MWLSQFRWQMIPVNNALRLFHRFPTVRSRLPPRASLRLPWLRYVAWRGWSSAETASTTSSTGAAFAQSTLAGVSVSVAVICEELPHELGDLPIDKFMDWLIRMAVLINMRSCLLLKAWNFETFSPIPKLCALMRTRCRQFGRHCLTSSWVTKRPPKILWHTKWSPSKKNLGGILWARLPT